MSEPANYIVTAWIPVGGGRSSPAVIASIRWPENQIIRVDVADPRCDMETTDAMVDRHMEEVCRIGDPIHVVLESSMSRIDSDRIQSRILALSANSGQVVNSVTFFCYTREKLDNMLRLLEHHTPSNTQPDFIECIQRARNVGFFRDGDTAAEAVALAVYSAVTLSLPRHAKF